MASKKYWVVKVNKGSDGWVILDTFKTSMDADEAIAKICKKQGVPYTDFIVKPITMMA